jgi:hypothetical protein
LLFLLTKNSLESEKNSLEPEKSERNGITGMRTLSKIRNKIRSKLKGILNKMMIQKFNVINVDFMDINKKTVIKDSFLNVIIV